MLTRKHSILGKDPFGRAAELFETLDPEAAMKLAMVAGDITLVIDCDGTIIDSAIDPNDYPDFVGWEGSPWVETVTIESRPKVTEMLEAACRGEVQHWRQVNHPSSDGDIPVRYAVLAVNGGRAMHCLRPRPGRIQPRAATSSSGAAVARTRLSRHAPARNPLRHAVRTDG